MSEELKVQVQLENKETAFLKIEDENAKALKQSLESHGTEDEIALLNTLDTQIARIKTISLGAKTYNVYRKDNDKDGKINRVISVEKELEAKANLDETQKTGAETDLNTLAKNIGNGNISIESALQFISFGEDPSKGSIVPISTTMPKDFKTGSIHEQLYKRIIDKALNNDNPDKWSKLNLTKEKIHSAIKSGLISKLTISVGDKAADLPAAIEIIKNLDLDDKGDLGTKRFVEKFLNDLNNPAYQTSLTATVHDLANIKSDGRVQAGKDGGDKSEGRNIYALKLVNKK